MRPLRSVIFAAVLLGLPASAQEHNHGGQGQPVPAPGPMESTRHLDAVLRDEGNTLKRIRASVRARDRERLGVSVDQYVSVQDELRGGILAQGAEDAQARKKAARVTKACRESLGTLRGLADGVPPALGERVDVAVAAAERTLGVAAEVSAPVEEPAVAPRRGGCGMGSSGHGGH